MDEPNPNESIDSSPSSPDTSDDQNQSSLSEAPVPPVASTATTIPMLTSTFDCLKTTDTKLSDERRRMIAMATMEAQKNYEDAVKHSYLREHNPSDFIDENDSFEYPTELPMMTRLDVNDLLHRQTPSTNRSFARAQEEHPNERCLVILQRELLENESEQVWASRSVHTHGAAVLKRLDSEEKMLKDKMVELRDEIEEWKAKKNPEDTKFLTVCGMIPKQKEND